MNPVYGVLGYLLGVLVFARLWYAFYPWKKRGSYSDMYQFWGTGVHPDQLRSISTWVALTWPILAPACVIWIVLFHVPWMGTTHERAIRKTHKREKQELEMREREARVAEMERSLGITR